MAKINDSIGEKVDAAMKNALGTDGGKKSPESSAPAAVASLNDSGEREDATYLVRGLFGNR
jgi:hypothetical protein